MVERIEESVVIFDDIRDETRFELCGGRLAGLGDSAEYGGTSVYEGLCGLGLS